MNQQIRNLLFFEKSIFAEKDKFCQSKQFIIHKQEIGHRVYKSIDFGQNIDFSVPILFTNYRIGCVLMHALQKKVKTFWPKMHVVIENEQ